MGTSTDGILCYGFPINNEEDDTPAWLFDGDPEDEDSTIMCFSDFLAKLYELPDPGEWGEDEATHARFIEYWAKQRQLEKEVGIELVYHCSGEYPMYILAAKESVISASRGSPQGLGQSIVAKPEWRENLEGFCEKAGIEFQEPQFQLCSYWT